MKIKPSYIRIVTDDILQPICLLRRPPISNYGDKLEKGEYYIETTSELSYSAIDYLKDRDNAIFMISGNLYDIEIYDFTQFVEWKGTLITRIDFEVV